MTYTEKRNSENVIYAPFTPEQIKNLNEYQAGPIHPFTCGSKELNCNGVLIATEKGWMCPKCSYTQNWAHESMSNGEMLAAMKDFLNKTEL